MPGKLRMRVSTGYVGCGVEEETNLPDDWSEMSQADRDAWIEQTFDDFIQNSINSDYHVVEDEQ